jgi:hypothetical protein
MQAHHFILLVGLPGSGKTYTGNRLGFPFLDDYSKNPVEIPDDPIIVISDYWFPRKKTQEAAVRTLSQRHPGSTFQWICFENNLEKCWRNVQKRNDGRVITYESMKHLSEQFHVPDGEVAFEQVYEG